MSSTAYTRTIVELAPEGAMYKKRYQSGRKTTGADRERPQPYVLMDGEAISWKKWKTGVTDWNPKDPTSRSVHRTLPFSTEGQALRNAAYGKLKEAIVGDNAALGVFAAESRESYGMIQKRALGLYRAYKKLRKGDFRGSLRELSVSPKRKHRNLVRNAAHEASGLWLEYWFGWSPAISDIYTAVDQLSQEPPYMNTKFKGAVSRPFSDIEPRWGTQDWTGRMKIRTSANARLVNPNAFLHSQLGITNPASVVWELIPFSFLADWCFDVSSFLDSATDFIGLELSEEQSSETCTGKWTWRPASTQTGLYVARQTFMERRLGLSRPLPNLEISSNLGVSKTRAASAVSLLTQILRV